MIASHRQQKGAVLVLGLLILLVMTTLGVKAILGSNLQERLVANQKQTIEAAMAAESGAVLAVEWLRTHPEAWKNGEAWKNDPALPSSPPALSNGNSGPVYWIERIDFQGDAATLVSRGGVWVGNEILAQRTVTAALQDEGHEPDSALATNGGAETVERSGERLPHPVHESKGGVAAATGSLDEIAGLKTIAGAAGEPTTIRDDASGTGEPVIRDSPFRSGKIRGKILFWRLSAGVEESPSGERP